MAGKCLRKLVDFTSWEDLTSLQEELKHEKIDSTFHILTKPEADTFRVYV